MKSLSLFALSAAVVGFALTSCEPHSFEETKGLNLEHGAHHETHPADGEHGKDTHAKDEHAKDVHPEKTPEPKPEPAKGEPRKTGI